MMWGKQCSAEVCKGDRHRAHSLSSTHTCEQTVRLTRVRQMMDKMDEKCAGMKNGYIAILQMSMISQNIVRDK